MTVNTNSATQTEKNDTTKQLDDVHGVSLKNVEHPEMFIGFVAPIGVDTNVILRALNKALHGVGYDAKHIKLTDLMKGVPSSIQLTESPTENRYDTYIRYANEIREAFHEADSEIDGNSALAMLAVAGVRAARKELTGSYTKPAIKTAYIFDQFKRPEEVALIRRIYGRLFILISVHASVPNRKHTLKRKILASHGDRSKIDPAKIAQDLISRDSHEESIDHGQRVRDSFPLADVVIDGNDSKKAEHGIDRLIKLLFGYNFITPTRDEYGMFIAKAASLRSADLSRQVGAAIFSKETEVISLGSNEVPKPGGGTYFEGDEPDHRDYAQGVDYNEIEKRAIAIEAIELMHAHNLINLPKSNERGNSLEDTVDYLFNHEHGPRLKRIRAMDILEFGRQIHAEMSALVDAARLGRSVKGATLFCTTFPCHMCAKLILGSGIDRVVYIEPYPKSYAEDMYSHAIGLDGTSIENEPHVQFHHFTGIAPFRYRDFFEKGRRKSKDGSAQEWKDGKPRPNVSFMYETYLHFEVHIMGLLARKIDRAKTFVEGRRKQQKETP